MTSWRSENVHPLAPAREALAIENEEWEIERRREEVDRASSATWEGGARSTVSPTVGDPDIGPASLTAPSAETPAAPELSIPERRRRLVAAVREDMDDVLEPDERLLAVTLLSRILTHDRFYGSAG